MAHPGGGQSAGQGRQWAAGRAWIGGGVAIAAISAAALLVSWQNRAEGPAVGAIADAGPLAAPTLAVAPAPVTLATPHLSGGAVVVPTRPAADADAAVRPAEPSPGTKLVDKADAPALGSASGELPAAGSDPAPAGARPAAPALPSQADAGGLPSLPAPDKDPAANAPEPAVPTAAPGGLGAPTAEASIAAPGPVGAGSPPPATGTVQSRQSLGAAAADQPLATVSVQNRPPTVESAASGPVSAAQGQPVHARLGAFFDEDGPSGMALRIEGTVPNGVSVRLSESGVAEVHGTPAEAGEYAFHVTVVDPHGLVSQPIPVALSIAPPAENMAVRDYVTRYDGGDCFLSRALEIGPEFAEIEVFASQDKLQRVTDFEAAFTRDMGFAARIGVRPVSTEQCPLIHALYEVGPQALDGTLTIDLDRDELASGDRLSGRILGGQGARLFLYDHRGGLTDLSSYVESLGGETGFVIPVSAVGPQILIAARPRAGGEIGAPPGGLERIIGAARRGEAALALGFFVMK